MMSEMELWCWDITLIFRAVRLFILRSWSKVYRCARIAAMLLWVLGAAARIIVDLMRMGLYGW